MFSETFYHKLEHSLKRQETFALITLTEHPNPTLLGKKTLIWPDGTIEHDFICDDKFSSELTKHCSPLLAGKKTKSVTFNWENHPIECYVDVFTFPRHLIIAGAGHVSEPVAQLGKMLDFFVTVIDDRPEFATKERFPFADEVVCQPFLPYFQQVALTEKTYILLLTRGHKYDVVSLKQLLRRKERPAYIGMIGSQRRISGVFEQLRSEFPEETFTSVYSPVGIDIGAETPAEIAVSILGEILKVKNERSGQSLSEVVRKRAKLKFRERRKR